MPIRPTRASRPARRPAPCGIRLALVVAAGALLFGAGDAGAIRISPGLGSATIAIPPVPGTATGQQDEDSTSLLDAGTAGRWLTYIAVFLMLGAFAFGPIADRAFRRLDSTLDAIQTRCRSMAVRLGLVGAVLYIVGALGRLYAQVLVFLFPGDPLTAADFRLMVFETSWGHRWLVQVACALVAATGFAMGRRRPKLGLPLAGFGAVAAAATLPLTGHAMAASWSVLVTLPLQALHVLAGGAWLGSLLVVTIVGFAATSDTEKADRERTIAGLVHAFSPVALGGVAVAIAMGLILSVSYVGSWSALWLTSYGLLLLTKVALVGITGLIGAYNWRRIRPRLGEPGSAGTLRLSARAELLVGAILLAATAILVSLPAPHV